MTREVLQRPALLGLAGLGGSPWTQIAIQSYTDTILRIIATREYF